MSNVLPYVVGGLELTLASIGAVLLWRLALSPKARTNRPATPLLPWNAPVSEFLLFLLLALAGVFLAALSAEVSVKYLPFRGDAATLFKGSAAQLGALGGIFAYWARSNRDEPRPPAPQHGIFVSGLVTFLISLPVLIATAKAWDLFLQLCGLPIDKQELIGMFRNADSPAMLTIMIVLAVAIAPLVEELVFRAGLFRYFRTRMPHWIALLGPAIFFATLHVNWRTLQGLSSVVPLMVLAMVFSLAYERTGRIGTAIVAHGLFNLHTVLLIFSGVAV
jgi:uncharacterized protein